MMITHRIDGQEFGQSYKALIAHHQSSQFDQARSATDRRRGWYSRAILADNSPVPRPPKLIAPDLHRW